ncbi:hypothetical protein PsYK624_074540 [Phanerochaete sordida]|uniref:Uncharacterized protein n=1 Tax=Phanerochaete sordida TaxID=48140 RepID=A0A9P3GCE4_9APHY|nr:hypothetical protein PsYK624_074540 [Phanerochaete sordida]
MSWAASARAGTGTGGLRVSPPRANSELYVQHPGLQVAPSRWSIPNSRLEGWCVTAACQASVSRGRRHGALSSMGGTVADVGVSTLLDSSLDRHRPAAAVPVARSVVISSDDSFPAPPIAETRHHLMFLSVQSAILRPKPTWCPALGYSCPDVSRNRTPLPVYLPSSVPTSDMLASTRSHRVLLHPESLTSCAHLFRSQGRR